MGTETSVIHVPLPSVNIWCSFVSGVVRVGVRDRLPIVGFDLMLGKDLAGVKVFPTNFPTCAPKRLDLMVDPICRVRFCMAQTNPKALL